MEEEEKVPLNNNNTQLLDPLQKSGGGGGHRSHHFKSPGTGLGGDDNDYSLSVSDMNMSLYNSSNRGTGKLGMNNAAMNNNNDMMMGSIENNTMPPRFQY